MLVLLQSADGPSLGNRAFDGSLQGALLAMTVAENHYLSGSHHGTNTYGQSQTRYPLRIIIEETGVGNLGICSERLYSGAGGKRREWLVESDMAIRTDTTDKEVDATRFFYHLLIMTALLFQILGITVQDMNILLRAVDMIEEIAANLLIHPY